MKKLSTKILIWHAAVAVFVWRVFALGNSLKFDDATGFGINIPLFVWFLLAVSVIGLGYVLFRKRWWSLSISVIVALMFFIFLGLTWLNISAAVIFWLCNVWAEERAMSDMQERIKINMSRTLVSVLIPIVLGFFVIASFAAYQSSLAGNIQKANQLPSQTEVFIRNIIDNTFGSKLGPDNSKARQDAVGQIASQMFKNINDFLHPYFGWAPPLLAFGLFLILWGLSWFFVYAGTLVALLLFWILKKTRVVRIESKDVKAEELLI